MLDQLFNKISGEVVNSITEKAGISTEQAQQVLPIAKESVESGLMDQVKGGNITGILNMFNSDKSSLGGNPIFDNIKNIMMANVMTKMGLPKSVATLIASSGLTSIIGKLSGLLSGNDGEVTQSSLMSHLDMGSADGMMDMAKNLAKDKLGGKLGDIAGGLFGK